MQQKCELARSLHCILQASKHWQTKLGINKMRKDIEIGSHSSEQDSRLWLAVALSFTMIFSSYAVSVLNHRNDGEVSARTQLNRSIVVSYLA